MRPRSLFALALLAPMALVAQAPSAPSRSVAPSDARIAYMGRLSVSDAHARMGFPGVTTRFRFRGPAPAIKLTATSEDCYFNLSCNGWEPVVLHLKKGENLIQLPMGRAPKEGWDIDLVRRTESWMGEASFDGLELPEGCELLSPASFPARKLLFFGDSITCGEYVEKYPPEFDMTQRMTNATRSFAMVLGRWLNAQVHLVAYGGKGITREWSGRTDKGNLPDYLSRALPDDPTSTWDHHRYQPEAIVINAGTDFDHDIPDIAKLTEAYHGFVKQVRTAYPKAFIFLCESGYHSDGSDGEPTTSRELSLRMFQTLVERQKAAGDARVRLVRSGFHRGTPKDTHLVAFQQEQIAQDLLGPIKEATGW